jgi:hypothetical protein
MANTSTTVPARSAGRFPSIFWVTMASKVALVALLVFAVVRDDLPQFQGKAMEGRALLYPISILVVPIGYWLVRRSRPVAGGYPYALDILLGLPFLIDVGGNALNLYDTIEWWDDLNHLVNWGILSAAFGQFLLRLPVGKLATAGLVAGFGAITAIIWELAEYVTFVRNSPELATAYTDTLGDLTLGTAGSIIAGVVTAWVVWPGRAMSNEQ